MKTLKIRNLWSSHNQVEVFELCNKFLIPGQLYLNKTKTWETRDYGTLGSDYNLDKQVNPGDHLTFIKSTKTMFFVFLKDDEIVNLDMWDLDLEKV